MKSRIFTYLILLPIILLVTFTSVSEWLSYAGWVAFGLCILLLIYAALKTSAFYHSKKLILITVFCLLGLVHVSYAQTLLAPTQSVAPFDPESTIKAYNLDDPNKEDPCVPVTQLYDEAADHCWICEVAALFIEAGDKVATLFFAKVKEEGYAQSLLMIGLFCWLLMRALSLIGSFGAADLGKFFTDLLIKCLLGGGVAVMLMVPFRDTAEFFMSPFFLVSSTINQSLMDFSKDISSDVTKLDVAMADQFGKAVQCKYCEDLANNSDALPDADISAAVGYDANNDERAVSPILRNSILCSVCSAYKVTAPPVVAGQFLFCSASQLEYYDRRLKKLTYSNWDAVLVGLFLTFTFTLISVIFAFYFIDSFVRICFVLVLYPFLLVAFVFKSTRQYTKRAFDMLLHAMGTYIILGILLVLIIQMFYVMLSPVTDDLVAALSDENTYTALEKLLTFLKGSGVIILASIAIVFVSFFLLQGLYGYVADFTGVDLSNGGGAAAVLTTTATVATMTHTISEVYTTPSEWRNMYRSARDENGEYKYGTEAKSRSIKRYFDSKHEGMNRTADSLENNWNPNFRSWEETKLNEARESIRTGGIFGRMAGRIKYATVAVAATTRKAVSVSWWGRRISAGSIRGSAAVMKALAHNRYLNRTVAFGMSVGSDVYRGTSAVKNGVVGVGRKTMWLGRRIFGNDNQNNNGNGNGPNRYR